MLICLGGVYREKILEVLPKNVKEIEITAINVVIELRAKVNLRLSVISVEVVALDFIIVTQVVKQGLGISGNPITTKVSIVYLIDI